MAAAVGLVAVVAFVPIAGLVVWLEQQNLRRTASAEAHQSVAAVQSAVEAALWSVDRDALLLLLRPIVKDGSIAQLRLVDGDNVLVDLHREGEVPATADDAGGPSWTQRLLAPDRQLLLGELHVTESYTHLKTDLRLRAPTLLAAEALKVALVAAGVLWLLHRRLTRPLRRLAGDLAQLSIDQPDARLLLDRPRSGPEDELDGLVASINQMHKRLVAESAQRGQAERRELSQAAERALILASVADGVLAFDRRGLPLYANRSAMQLLDLDGDDLRTSLRQQAGDRRDRWRGHFAELRADCKRSGTAVQRRVTDTVRHRDGRELPSEFSLTALPDGPLGFVVTVRDLSAERLAEQAAAESRAARAADRAKSEFLSRISHELRTPLSAVLGLSDVLLADQSPALHPRHREWLSHVHAAGQHLLRLVSDLLDLSRIEAGTMALNLSVQPLGPLITQVVELSAPAAQALGIGVVTNLHDPHAALVNADPTRFTQVLSNLLSNAIKYNRPGGTVTLTVLAAERLEITVSDTGLGMNPQQLARLFTPFSRLGRENSRIEGTGIGLVIARHLTELMGGTLGCTSQEGQGTVFVLTLPRAAAADAAPAVALAAPEAQPDQVRTDVAGRVLVVEDDEVNRLILELYLQRRPQVQASFAASVEAATALLATAAPQLALIDMHLGPRSGTEVLAAVRAQPGGAPVRCVAFSAEAMPDQVQALLAAGFDDYWIKPMGLEDFLRRLDEALAPRA